MKIKLINNSNISFRMYFVKNGKKIYKHKIKTLDEEYLEIHFDEMKNMNKIFLFLNRLLFCIAYTDSNDNTANMIINEDVFVAKINCKGIEQVNFTIDEKMNLSCENDALILCNERKNDNPRMSSIKALLYISALVVILVAIIALAFYLAGGPF